MTVPERYKDTKSLEEQRSLLLAEGVDSVTGLPVLIYRFEGEPEAGLEELESDNAPRVLWLGREGTTTGLVVALEPGWRFRNSESGPLRPSELLDLTRALRDAAAVQLVHGDIRPERLLIAGSGLQIEGFGVPWRPERGTFTAPEYDGTPTLAGDVWSLEAVIRKFGTTALDDTTKAVLELCAAENPGERPTAEELYLALERLIPEAESAAASAAVSPSTEEAVTEEAGTSAVGQSTANEGVLIEGALEEGGVEEGAVAEGGDENGPAENGTAASSAGRGSTGRSSTAHDRAAQNRATQNPAAQKRAVQNRADENVADENLANESRADENLANENRANETRPDENRAAPGRSVAGRSVGGADRGSTPEDDSTGGKSVRGDSVEDGTEENRPEQENLPIPATVAGASSSSASKLSRAAADGSNTRSDAGSGVGAPPPPADGADDGDMRRRLALLGVLMAAVILLALLAVFGPRPGADPALGRDATVYVVEFTVAPEDLPPVTIHLVSSPPGSSLSRGERLGTAPRHLALERGTWVFQGSLQDRRSEPVEVHVPEQRSITLTIPPNPSAEDR